MLILRLSKREDQALIPISTILKFSALKYYGIRLKLKYREHSQFLYQIVVSFSGKSCLTGFIKLVPFFSSFICFSDVQRCLFSVRLSVPLSVLVFLCQSFCLPIMSVKKKVYLSVQHLLTICLNSVFYGWQWFVGSNVREGVSVCVYEFA